LVGVILKGTSHSAVKQNFARRRCCRTLSLPVTMNKQVVLILSLCALLCAAKTTNQEEEDDDLTVPSYADFPAPIPIPEKLDSFFQVDPEEPDRKILKQRFILPKKEGKTIISFKTKEFVSSSKTRRNLITTNNY
jgi:hypothetical protein